MSDAEEEKEEAEAEARTWDHLNPHHRRVGTTSIQNTSNQGGDLGSHGTGRHFYIAARAQDERSKEEDISKDKAG